MAVGSDLLPCLEEHVKPSVLIGMNIYGNVYWEVSALKHTDTKKNILTSRSTFKFRADNSCCKKNRYSVKSIELVANHK